MLIDIGAANVMFGTTALPQFPISVIRISTLLLVTAVLSACGTLYKLEVDARNLDQSALEGDYVLLSGDKKISESDPEFQKYSAMIERGLSRYNLNRLSIERIEDADSAIILDYGIGDSEIVAVNRKTPMFQSQPSAGAENASGEKGPRSSSQGQQGASAPTGVVDASPEQQLIGTQETTFIRTVYWRDLRLHAVAIESSDSSAREIKGTHSLWSVTVQSLGSSTDLDEVMPVLVVAAMPYVGEHLAEPAAERINGTDRRIKEIAGIE